jgi:hypothetical protein
MVRPGWVLVNAPTAFWQSGGTVGFTVGCGVVGPVFGVRAGVVLPGGMSAARPRNDAVGQVSMVWMAQSSTSCWTVRPSAERGKGLPSFHASHAPKNYLAS